MDLILRPSGAPSQWPARKLTVYCLWPLAKPGPRQSRRLPGPNCGSFSPRWWPVLCSLRTLCCVPLFLFPPRWYRFREEILNKCLEDASELIFVPESSSVPLRPKVLTFYCAAERALGESSLTQEMIACLQDFHRMVLKLFVWGKVGDHYLPYGNKIDN